MKSRPLVSICVPVYNGEKFILDTINSAINQTYDNTEIIVIDNCSLDNTLPIVESIKNKKLRIINNEKNLGMVGNWNKCIAEANGKYIVILCADDILLPTCIEEKVLFLEKHKEAVLVSSFTDIIDENNKVIFTRKSIKKTKVYDGLKIFKKSIRTKNIFGEPSNVLFRKEVALKTDGYVGGLPYSPDWEYWLHLSTLGDIGFISEPLTQYRVASTCATDSLLKNKEKLESDARNFFCSVNQYYKVTKFDIIMNRLNQTIRTLEKRVFYLLFTK